MMTLRISMAAAIFGIASVTFAASGTPDEQDACRPDVRKFCHKLKETDGDDAFLKCLQDNRAKLSTPCRTLLESHGR
jgi:cysteine rich repeat protein